MSMHTLDQLLDKVLKLLDAQPEGDPKPDLVCLTPDDERALIAHEWKKGELQKKPPSVRSIYKKLAGLDVEWDAPETSLRCRTPEEKTAKQEAMRQGLDQMRDANRQLAENHERDRRNRFGGY